MNNGKDIHKIFTILDIGVLVAFVLSLIFKSPGVEVGSTNIDANNGLTEMVEVTNKDCIEMKYFLQKEVVEGIILYFNVYEELKQTDAVDEVLEFDGSAEEIDAEKKSNGVIHYRLLGENGEVFYEGDMQVDQIIKEKSYGVLTGTEFKMDIGSHESQILTIELQGRDIPENISVKMLGNANDTSEITAMKNGKGFDEFPVYQMEIAAKEMPYSWDLAVAFVVLLLLTILTKENKRSCGKN